MTLTMETLPDIRALGLQDVPYSAYCRVCWNNYYRLWVPRADHGGVCVHGHKQATDCPQAMAREKLKAEIQELKRQGLIK